MLGASVLRWIAVAFVQAPALLLLLQASHAITFGGTYLGLIGFMVEFDELAVLEKWRGRRAPTSPCSVASTRS